MMEQIDAIWLHWPETKALAQAVVPLRFVGGSVRDALLNREVRDVDAATPLSPDRVMTALRAAGIKAVPTGIDHGTVTAVIGARHFEITTLRRDVSTDGRHATVAFTEDWKEDASRRDFTMNALFCDREGRVFDYFGGADDARAGRVRFIGDPRARIREDALRILRFFRFYAHYGVGPADAEGLAACGELAQLMSRLSGERVCQEMLKLLAAEQAADVVGLMQRHGVWPEVVGAVVTTEALGRLPEVGRKTHCAPDGLLALALLLRGAAGDRPALIAAVAARWKLSKAQEKRLHALCESPPVRYADETECKKRIRAWGRDRFIDATLIAMAEGAQEASALAALDLAREWEVPAFPVTGDDLIALGARPGKELGQTLRALEAAWEESGYALSKNELLVKDFLR